MPSRSPFPCPICGGTVPAKAKACPKCGACDKTGWNVEATADDGLDLPGNDFDYDRFTAEEFGSPAKPSRRQLLWKITTLVLVLVFVVLIFFDALFR